MLRIIVEIVPPAPSRPAREVARAEISNVSDDDKISDYAIEVEEGVNGVTWAKAWESRGMILAHDREQSVWALVAKAANFALAESEKQGGQRLSLVANPEALPHSVAERIRKIAEGAVLDDEFTAGEMDALDPKFECACGTGFPKRWNYCPNCGRPVER